MDSWPIVMSNRAPLKRALRGALGHTFDGHNTTGLTVSKLKQHSYYPLTGVETLCSLALSPALGTSFRDTSITG